MAASVPVAVTLAGIARRAAPARHDDRVEDLRAHLLDTLGLIAAGAHTETASRARDYAIDIAGRSDLGACERAFVWAAAADALALDDFDEPTRLHPGAAVVPAALAALPSTATPTEFEAAVAAGYEVMLRLGDAAGSGRLHARGLHPSSVFGTIGAAASAGVAGGLTDDDLTSALGIAASLASGHFALDGANRMRGVQMGQAASNGLRACRLAVAGFKPAQTAFEGTRGFLELFTGQPHLLSPLDLREGTVRTPDVSFKPFAHFTDLNPMTAALVAALSNEHAETGRGPHSVEIVMDPAAATKLVPVWPPRDAKSAQRCPQWVAACLLDSPVPPQSSDPLLALLKYDPMRVEALSAAVGRVVWETAVPEGGGVCTVTVVRPDASRQEFIASGYPGDGRDSSLRWKSAAIAARLNTLGPAASKLVALWLNRTEQQGGMVPLLGCLGTDA